MWTLLTLKRKPKGHLPSILSANRDYCGWVKGPSIPAESQRLTQNYSKCLKCPETVSKLGTFFNVAIQRAVIAVYPRLLRYWGSPFMRSDPRG